MVYPTISEYIEAIRYAEENLATLTHLRPVLDKDGNPVMSSGNFAVVFKMQDGSGKFYALKCFTRDQEGRAEAYKIICDELAKIASPYFVNTEYYDKKLFVDTQQTDETEFPVLLMDWVEGENLMQYIKNFNQFNLYELSFKFNQFAQWMVEQPFAHGDLKPDNIIIQSDGSLVVVDYDGMFFPQMRGQQARELGSPDYRHPNHTTDDFNEHIDDLALASIALSLNAIALDSQLLKHNHDDNLLFTEKDYRDIANSEMLHILLKKAQSDKELGCYISTFLSALYQNPLNKTHFDFSSLYKDFVNAEGVLTRKHVLWLGLNKQEKVILPKCVKAIGDNAFTKALLKKIAIPNSVTKIGWYAFSDCCDMSNISVESNNNKYDSRVNCNAIIETTSNTLIAGCRNTIIPSSVISIGKYAFSGCSGLTSINIPSSVTEINDSAFERCSNLTSVNIPDSVTEIGWGTFSCCSSLSSVSIPHSLTEIIGETFYGCCSLTSVTIPNSVTKIGSSAFKNCTSLTLMTIPNSVTTIGWQAFAGCSGLTSVHIPASTTRICDLAFEGTPWYANEPNGLVYAGLVAYKYKGTMTKGTSIKVKDGTRGISDDCFSGCLGLTGITIPDSVISIGREVFWNCSNLSKIIIPAGSMTHFQKLLPKYSHLLVEKSDNLEYWSSDDDLSIDDLPF